MEDIHSPSVPATSSSSTATAAPSDARDPAAELFKLMAEKDRVEEELKALGAVLDSV